MKHKSEGKESGRLICRAHQRNLDEKLQRKFRLVKQDASRATEYAVEQPTGPSYGVQASMGKLVRAGIFKGPFLPPEDIRFFRFEQGVDCTDNIDEIKQRRERAQGFQRKLKRLLGIDE
jgi:hypothetical protein